MLYLKDTEKMKAIHNCGVENIIVHFVVLYLKDTEKMKAIHNGTSFLGKS